MRKEKKIKNIMKQLGYDEWIKQQEMFYNDHHADIMEEFNDKAKSL